MIRKIRWGVISTASIGRRRVIPAIQASRNGEVAAIASRDLEKAKAAAAELNIPKAYGSYEELIAAPDIDAIYNPLPNDQHAEWSIRCAEAGKPVLCEKPLAVDATQAQHMVDFFAARGVPLAEAFMYRFHPQTQRVKQIVSSGGIGQVHIIQATFSFPIASETNIRLSKAMAGGALMDVGCYCVNVMRHMTGEEPDRVSALASWGPQSGVDERLVGLLGFPSGVMGHLDCSLRSHFTNIYEIRGSRGRLLVEKAFTPHAPDPAAGTTVRYWHDDSYEEIPFGPSTQYTLMAEDFADALLEKRPPRFPIQDAVNNMRVIDRLLTAARA